MDGIPLPGFDSMGQFLCPLDIWHCGTACTRSHLGLLAARRSLASVDKATLHKSAKKYRLRGRPAFAPGGCGWRICGYAPGKGWGPVDNREFLYRLSAKIFLHHNWSRLMYLDNPDGNTVIRLLALPDVY